MLEADYLIVGSGAMGMAFADTLLSESDASMIIVDHYAKPGGHWNLAYPFVTLHQPSQFYGVSSKELSRGRKDTVGLNKGFYELATGAEINSYYEEVMRDTFLSSGRVQYFPKCDYQGDHQFKSLLSGETFEVKVKKKLIDCTYLKTTVPSAHTPNFSVDPEVRFIPINDLVDINKPVNEYVVIGGGKTGIDACIWLLQNHVPPDRIKWIVSRDAWLLNRENTQPGQEFFEKTIGTQAHQFEAIAESSSIDDLFDRLEAANIFLRLDQNVRPSMFHGATVSKQELAELRKIEQIVRLGKVKHIESTQIILENGTIPTSTENLHVDCSASAITNLETKPIFQGDVITPQTVRAYQPVFSASVAAYVEVTYEDDKKKNNICQVVPLPNADIDWIRMTAMQMVNQLTWSQDRTLRKWVKDNRLDGFGKIVMGVDRSDKDKMAIITKLRQFAMPAMMKLQQYNVELQQSS